MSWSRPAEPAARLLSSASAMGVSCSGEQSKRAQAEASGLELPGQRPLEQWGRATGTQVWGEGLHALHGMLLMGSLASVCSLFEPSAAPLYLSVLGLPRACCQIATGRHSAQPGNAILGTAAMLFTQ